MAEQQKLITLLQIYSNERLQGDHAVEEFKGQNAALDVDLEKAREVLEEAKCKKKSAEERLKELQIDLASTEAALKSRQARVQTQQEEMAKATKEATALEKEEQNYREKFIKEMLDFNERMRNMRHYYSESNLKSSFEEKSGKISFAKEEAEKILSQEDNFTDLCIENMRNEEKVLLNRYDEMVKKKHEMEQRITVMEAISHATQALQETS